MPLGRKGFRPRYWR